MIGCFWLGGVETMLYSFLYLLAGIAAKAERAES